MGTVGRERVSMPRKALPRISSVAPGRKPLTLKIRWSSGDQSSVDVSGLINSFRLYEPLRDNSKLFRQVRIGEHGTDIVWNDHLDISNDTLWRLFPGEFGGTKRPRA